MIVGRFFSSLTSPLIAVALLISCSAGGDGSDSNSGPEKTDGAEEPATGGAASASSSGGLGGTSRDQPQPHPLIGAGNHPSVDQSDPCHAAQHWELDVMLDMTQGALILADGVVYEITGEGIEHGWTMEMNAPPCTTPNTVCDDLLYEEVTTCPE